MIMLTSLENKDDISKRVEDILTILRCEVDHTSDLHSIGVNTKLSATLYGLITNPIRGLVDTHRSSYHNLKKLVSQLTIAFFYTKSDLILKAFQQEQQNQLIYFIVLKNDTPDNRDVFFEFLYLYDELGIQDNLPVMIKFLPERVMDKANLKDEVILN